MTLQRALIGQRARSVPDNQRGGIIDLQGTGIGKVLCDFQHAIFVLVDGINLNETIILERPGDQQRPIAAAVAANNDAATFADHQIHTDDIGAACGIAGQGTIQLQNIQRAGPGNLAAAIQINGTIQRDCAAACQSHCRIAVDRECSLAVVKGIRP